MAGWLRRHPTDRTLRDTAAMAGELSERLWSVADTVAQVEVAEAADGPKKRSPYEPRVQKAA